MGYIQDADVAGLLQDSEFVNELAAAVAQDPEGIDDLAEQVADKLSDALEDDASVRQQIVHAAVANPEFKRKVLRKIIDDMG